MSDRGAERGRDRRADRRHSVTQVRWRGGRRPLAAEQNSSQRGPRTLEILDLNQAGCSAGRVA
jgi:hypothetical protein